MSWILVKSRSSIVYSSPDKKKTQQKYTKDTFLNDLNKLETKVGVLCPQEKKTELHNIVFKPSSNDHGHDHDHVCDHPDLDHQTNPTNKTNPNSKSYKSHNFPVGTIIPCLLYTSPSPRDH
jgi:hypothetical protein